MTRLLKYYSDTTSLLSPLNQISFLNQAQSDPILNLTMLFVLLAAVAVIAAGDDIGPTEAPLRKFRVPKRVGLLLTCQFC